MTNSCISIPLFIIHNIVTTCAYIEAISTGRRLQCIPPSHHQPVLVVTSCGQCWIHNDMTFKTVTYVVMSSVTFAEITMSADIYISSASMSLDEVLPPVVTTSLTSLIVHWWGTATWQNMSDQLLHDICWYINSLIILCSHPLAHVPSASRFWTLTRCCHLLTYNMSFELSSDEVLPPAGMSHQPQISSEVLSSTGTCLINLIIFWWGAATYWHMSHQPHYLLMRCCHLVAQVSSTSSFDEVLPLAGTIRHASKINNLN